MAVVQFEIAKPGRRFETAGKEPNQRKFCGGTIFVDTASGVCKTYYQISLNKEETILSKNKFEVFINQEGQCNVQHYRTDNGIFTKQKVMNEILNKEQRITCYGVGAHHQNALAVRAICTVVTMTRTMMLHAVLCWPKETKTEFWPQAMQHATYLRYVIP